MNHKQMHIHGNVNVLRKQNEFLKSQIYSQQQRIQGLEALLREWKFWNTPIAFNSDDPDVGLKVKR